MHVFIYIQGKTHSIDGILSSCHSTLHYTGTLPTTVVLPAVGVSLPAGGLSECKETVLPGHVDSVSFEELA